MVASIFTPTVVGINEVADIIHVRDLWTAEWMAPNGTMMHGVTGKGVGVAIFDMGIDGTHNDLRNRIVCNVRQIYGGYWTEFPDNDLDQNARGHGTFCAGILAGDGTNSDGLYKGVAPEANLVCITVPLIIPPGVTVGYFLNDEDKWIYAHADEYNIRVTSVSLNWFNTTDSAKLKNVIEKKILYVWAAGNDGGDGTSDLVSNHPDKLGIMSIAGCWKDGKTMWEGSSRGDKNNKSTWPSATAPCCNIISTLGKNAFMTDDWLEHPDEIGLRIKGYGHRYGNGTSYACPQVSGVAALVFQVNPNLTPAQAKKIIELSADPVFGPYNETGWFAGHGLLNGTRAVAVTHYLALRPDSSVEEALKYYRIGWNGKTMVLNPLPLPEISVVDKIEKFVTPGFECTFVFIGIILIGILRSKFR
jgi:serine protease AprX